jgi:DNA polymerase III subunit epsilon
MQILFFDAESSHLFDFTKCAHEEGQPRLAEIGMIFVDGESGEIQSQHDFLIKPRGWMMSAEATEKTGLTTEYLEQHGGTIDEALDLYVRAIESRRVLAGWNLRNFDMKLMRGELRRAGKEDLFMQSRSLCLMQSSRNIVNALDKRGRVKMPKLEEACTHFNIKPDAAHRALADALATYHIWQKLREQGVHPELHDPYNKPKKPAKGKPRGRKHDSDEEGEDGTFHLDPLNPSGQDE